MANFSIPYTTPANYTYDSNKIEVSGGLAKLKLQNSLQSFVEYFANDTDFVYDSDLAEFVGGKVQQKSFRPSNATFYASYNNSINANWGNGSLIGTAYNGAVITGNKLDLTGSIPNKYVAYSPLNNADFTQTGCIRFKYTPNYSGVPTLPQYMISIGGGNRLSKITIYHYQNGYVRFIIYDSSGGWIGESIYYWNTAIAGTTYEIEANFDLTNGASRLFLNGNQIGTTSTGIGTRNALQLTYCLIGKDEPNSVDFHRTPNFYIDDILIFNTVQHTSNYTPNWANIKEYDYLTSSVICPEMEHTLPGDLTSFVSFVTVESGNPRYTLQVGRSGNYLYWNGSEWDVSDGSYSQANDYATFNTHVDDLIVYGETYGQFKIHFDNINIQGYVDTLTANLYMDIGYPSDKPTIYKTNGDSIANIEEWTTFTEILGSNNEGSIVYQLSEDGIIWKYWNGSVWTVATDDDYNSASAINTNIGDFPAEADKIYVKAILISSGIQQAELSSNNIGYTINTAPNVYAGSNKTAIYNIEINPFSDATFSDDEVNISTVEWKIEGGTYAEITQGDYDTLLEAVQSLAYTPTHSGEKSIYLKVTDSYGAYTEDSLVINVNRVRVTINILDEYENDLPSVTFDSGDGTSSMVASSSFTYDYYIGTWTATLSKTCFDALSESVTVSIATTEVTFNMNRETRIDELVAIIDAPRRYIKGDTLTFDGKIDINLTNYKIRCSIYDDEDNEIELATENSGGSDSQINIFNIATGEFLITCAKDLTDSFSNNVAIEIEIENSSGQIRTIFKENVEFEDEELTWTTP